jgi:hypothetical protein
MPDLPAEAVQAARDEARTWCTDLASDVGGDPSLLRQMVTMPGGMIDSAVEAAAPHIAAAERERTARAVRDLWMRTGAVHAQALALLESLEAKP